MESPLRQLSTFYVSAWRAMGNIQVLSIAVFGNLIMFPGALLFHWLERDVNSQVDTYFDAIWWAFCTVTTVGYGDVVPVTDMGRCLGIALMIVGTSCFIGFTAVFIPSVLAEYTQAMIKGEEVNLREIAARLERIERELQRLARRQPRP